jgi:hypothetical protein
MSFPSMRCVRRIEDTNLTSREGVGNLFAARETKNKINQGFFFL